MTLGNIYENKGNKLSLLPSNFHSLVNVKNIDDSDATSYDQNQTGIFIKRSTNNNDYFCKFTSKFLASSVSLHSDTNLYHTSKQSSSPLLRDCRFLSFDNFFVFCSVMFVNKVRVCRCGLFAMIDIFNGIYQWYERGDND